MIRQAPLLIAILLVVPVAFPQAEYFPPKSPPADLPNMAEAADRLEKAIRQRETICVWGDFDVDGQTATTLLVSTLRDLAVRQGSPQAVRLRRSAARLT